MLKLTPDYILSHLLTDFTRTDNNTFPIYQNFYVGTKRRSSIRQLIPIHPVSKFLTGPCIRLARLKFGLTNQDSEGGKTLLSIRQCLGNETGHLFSLEMALNTHRKGFTIPQTVSDCQNRKIWNTLCLQASNLGVYHHRASRVSNTHDRGARFKTRKTKANMAARGFFSSEVTFVLLETKFAYKGGFTC